MPPLNSTIHRAFENQAPKACTDPLMGGLGKSRLGIMLLVFACWSGRAHGLDVRVWNDSRGRAIHATMIRADTGNVILKLNDGREVPYPLVKLSEADRNYVEAVRGQATDHASAPQAKSDDPSGVATFESEWPGLVRFTEDPEIATLEEDAGKKRFVYESANYRYLCDVRLSQSVVKGFAVMFEATRLYCRSLPLCLNGGDKTDGKLQILLFEKQEDYASAGGPDGTAGVFISQKHAVLVPLTSLGVRPVGNGYMLDRDKSSKTLPHELAHQLTPIPYFKSGGWFTEGLAEYIGNTPYRAGTYTVRNNQRALVEYVTGYGSKQMGGRALGKKISLMDLKSFMLQEYSSFTSDPQRSYGCGLLLTIYFLHMDGEGDGARIKKFLKSLAAGKPTEESFALLLDGRTYEQLEKEITKAWSKNGVDLSFGKAPSKS